MKSITIFSNTKGFVSTLSVLNEVLKHKNENQLAKYLLKIKASYERTNSGLTRKLSR